MVFAVVTGSDVAGLGLKAADLTVRGFSRQQETKADEFGIALVHAEYGHVNEAWRLFERWTKTDNSFIDLATYLSTHPDSDDRTTTTLEVRLRIDRSAITANNITIPSGSVRVELEWYQAGGPPGVAHDLDGFVPNANYIYAWIDPPGFWSWFYADQLGVVGDWIVRMEIDTDAETPIFADGFESGDTLEWTVTSP